MAPVCKFLLASLTLPLSFCFWSCGGSTISSTASSPTTTAPPAPPATQTFSCPSGEEDVMQYFVLSKQQRDSEFMNGQPNPLYTEVFPDQDFTAGGYWFWLKSTSAHGFDVDAFDKNYVYLRSTELAWTDNTTFKRKHQDVPIAARCVEPDAPGPEIQVANTQIDWYASCAQYKSTFLGTIVNDLDAPVLIDTGGNIGQVMTRVLHYRYNCDGNFQNCGDEEQFFLGRGYGQWRWKHFQDGATTPAQVTLLRNIEPGSPTSALPCPQSYE
jgi:hypothetical protein